MYKRQPGVNVTDANFRIGSEVFRGQIDELRIWNVARTPAEIADNYKLSLPGDEPGIVAYWNFEDLGTDISGNGHTATPVNSLVRSFPGAPIEASLGSLFRILRVEMNSHTQAFIQWPALPGGRYAIESSTDMIEWIELDCGITSQGNTAFYFDTNIDSSADRKYYRVREMR